MRHSSTAPTAPAAPSEQPSAKEVHQVPPLNYMQLRLLAECAAGLEGDTNFVFTRDGNLDITEQPHPGAVLVPSRDRSKYPRNVVRMHTAPAHPGGTAEELRLEPGFADALFWSDSAVHKFVVPYVASCAGYVAHETLGRLKAAWNEYPADKVTVHALAHAVQHPQGAPLALENRLHVVYAERQNGEEGTTLSRATLAEFLTKYPPASGSPAAEPGSSNSTAASDATAAYSNGAGSTPLVEYQRGEASDRTQRPEYPTLRALAEHACSIAREPQYFVFKAGGHGFQRHTPSTLPEVEPGDIVIPAYTPTVPPQRPRLQGVWCDSEVGDTTNVAAHSDAMFWSDGALEQFLMPYYASKGGLHLGLRELQNLSELWKGTPARAEAENQGDEALRACQEKLRECEQKLRACEEKQGGPAGALADPDGATAYWQPDLSKLGQNATNATVVEENASYAVIHLSTSQYVIESQAGEVWYPTWTDSSGTQPGVGDPDSGTYDWNSDGNETAYLSPHREVGVLYSHKGKAGVLPAGELMARRRARRG